MNWHAGEDKRQFPCSWNIHHFFVAPLFWLPGLLSCQIVNSILWGRGRLMFARFVRSNRECEGIPQFLLVNVSLSQYQMKWGCQIYFHSHYQFYCLPDLLFSCVRGYVSRSLQLFTDFTVSQTPILVPIFIPLYNLARIAFLRGFCERGGDDQAWLFHRIAFSPVKQYHARP